MTTKVAEGLGSRIIYKMALLLILVMATSALSASTNIGEMTLANVTRLASGDIFSVVGTDCGPTRCMEVSHGTALVAMGGDGCMCKCRRDTPAFREDQRICVDHVDECSMATFGRGNTKPQIPFVFLPLKGQIVYPSKEIIFTEIKDAVCGVVSAQYLSASGWVTLRDVIDNDVPFSVYRDEGSTFLQWRGSAGLHARLEGRLVAAHVLCSTPEQQVASSCAAFRVAGASHSSLLDVRSIPFHAGETITPEPTQSQGLSVLESLAIGVCALMLIFIYAAGIIFYVHYKQKQKRREKDPENSNSMENGSMDSRIDMDNVQLKTNPLLGMGNINAGFCHDSGLSDVSEHTEETLDSSPTNTQKKPNSNVVAAMVHNRRKKPNRPSITNARAATTPERISERLQRRSASPDILERAPHSDLSVVDCSMEGNPVARQPFQSSNGEPVLRKKLYFNPVFFETEHLKDPPPAAIEFLMKIREIMSIAKDKMTTKKFIPMLSDIPEEDPYHSIDLGWDIPCARRGRRFSAISLKQENSRRSVHCGGCPGCDSNGKTKKTVPLTRSNSCKTCVSDDYKQRIVRKWLDEVPSPSPSVKPMKSVAKVSGTPRILEAKLKSDVIRPRSAEPLISEQKVSTTPEAKPKQQCNNEISSEMKVNKVTKDLKKEVDIMNNSSIIIKHSNYKVSELILPPPPPTKANDMKSPSNHISRRIRKKLPPPPPPPVNPTETMKGEDEEEVPILPEVKLKMEAVIREIKKCRRTEPTELEEIKMETVTPIAPKIVIPVVAADSQYYSDDNMLSDLRKKELFARKDNYNIEMDSLDRSMIQKRRRFSLACGPELSQRNLLEFQQKMPVARGRLTSSWRDLKKEVDDYQDHTEIIQPRFENCSEIFINTSEPIYDNITNVGPLTIKVSGSPVEKRRNKVYEDFDPDTLDRKPKRDASKRVEKILLKSGGSFKFKVNANENDNKPPSPPTIHSLPEEIFNRKIGSLRQIYEMKTKTQNNDLQFYNRRGSLPYSQDVAGFVKSLKTPDLIRQLEGPKDPKPPIPPKQRRANELSPKFSNSFRDSPSRDRRRILEERDHFHQYARAENINARRSGRRSARTRSRRTDLRKLYRTEDSGYMSTDSNESKRRAKYLLQLRPKIPEPVSVIRSVTRTPILPMESDTDDLESICDGRSESGGESVETDSVFFGNFDDTKDMLAELGLGYDLHRKLNHGHEQIDSGFMGETNIILSGDSDSEHRSVISIITGRDGRASSASITKLDDPPYIHSVEC